MGVTPVVLYATVALVINRNQKREAAGRAGEATR
jgi:hypothetical protein